MPDWRRPHPLATSAALAALAACATSLALPPVNLVWLAWGSFAPLLYAVERASAAGAGLAAGVFAGLLALLLCLWLPGVLRGGFGADLLGALALWLLAGASALPFAALYGLVLHRVGIRSPCYAPAAAVGWALVELGYGRVFPGLPWLSIGATQIDTEIAALAGALGVHGVSGLLAGVSALCVQAALHPRWSRVAPGAALLVIVGTLGLSSGTDPIEVPSHHTRIALVQPGLPMSRRNDPMFASDNIARLIRLSPVSQQPDLVVWPESAFPFEVDEGSRLRDRVQVFVDATGVPVLAGGYRRTGEQLRASVFLLRPGREPRPVYDKRRLLPLAEAAPSWAPPVLRRSLGRVIPPVPVAAGPGQSGDPPELSGVEVLLCHEAAFSGAGIDPGSSLIVNLVNDGWYDRSAGAAWHLTLSRWRAIETGAALVRVAATGTSALVQPDGVLARRLDVGEAGALTLDVELRSHVTWFEQLGYTPLVATALLLGTLQSMGWILLRSRSSPE